MKRLSFSATVLLLAAIAGCSGHSSETVIPDNPEPLPEGGVKISTPAKTLNSSEQNE